MYEQNQLKQQLDMTSLGKWALLGGGIALVLISVFLLGVDEPNPNWPTLWMLKPLIVVPLAGAVGGVFYYVMNHLFYRKGWRKILATIASLIVYIIGLWIGTVLGLDGTLWN